MTERPCASAASTIARFVMLLEPGSTTRASSSPVIGVISISSTVFLSIYVRLTARVDWPQAGVPMQVRFPGYCLISDATTRVSGVTGRRLRGGRKQRDFQIG